MMPQEESWVTLDAFLEKLCDALADLRNDLPGGLELYGVDGAVMFPRGWDHCGLDAELTIWLVREPERSVSPIELTFRELLNLSVVKKRLADAMVQFRPMGAAFFASLAGFMAGWFN